MITSGSTDWVWGLAERDPLVEQVTRNIFDRLSLSALDDPGVAGSVNRIVRPACLGGRLA